jgi:hypothetical protein
MKSKTVVFMILLLMVCTLSTWSETRKISEMGRHPFARPGVDVSAKEMGAILSQRYDGDIVTGFALSGYPELATPFLVELNSGRYGEEELAKGTVFSWMLFRANGKIKLVKDLEWAGNGPLPVYTYSVRHAGKDYGFVIPKPCGNVALVSVKEVVIQPVETVETPQAEPEEAAAPLLESVQPQPEPVQAIVADEEYRSLFFLVEAGPGVVRGSYTTIMWARLGIQVQLVPEKLDLIVAFGGGTPFRAEPHKAFIMGNALLSYHMQPFYLAGGLGFSTKERTSRGDGFDMVGQAGCDLFTSYPMTGSLFFEFRVPVITKARSFDQHYKALLGMRLIF